VRAVLRLQDLDVLSLGTLQIRFRLRFWIPFTCEALFAPFASEGTMRPKKHQTTGSNDLFRARLDQIINLKHELVQLAGKVDWG
jgi:hypothetical protein